MATVCQVFFSTSSTLDPSAAHATFGVSFFFPLSHSMKLSFHCLSIARALHSFPSVFIGRAALPLFVFPVPPHSGSHARPRSLLPVMAFSGKHSIRPLLLCADFILTRPNERLWRRGGVFRTFLSVCAVLDDYITWMWWPVGASLLFTSLLAAPTAVSVATFFTARIATKLSTFSASEQNARNRRWLSGAGACVLCALSHPQLCVSIPPIPARRE